MEISLTRALAEIKSIDGRFSHALGAGPLVAVTRGRGTQKKMHQYAETVETVERAIQSSFDQVTGLLARRTMLKAKIVAANAVGIVKIGGIEMTVAAAIERKRSITQDQQFLTTMMHQYKQCSQAVEALNKAVEVDIEKALVSVYQNDKGNIKPEQHEAVAAPRRESSEAALLDPCKIAETIKQKTEEIESFLTEVDFVLSEFNASTKISIDD